MSSPFDAILSNLAQINTVDPLEEIDSPEAPAKALFETIQTGSYTPPTRYTTSQYEPPETKSDYEKSAPFPTAFKADVNTKKGIVTAYLTTYLGNDGQPYVDPYKDAIHDTAFVDTLKQLEAQRKSKGNDWLVPDLWQHDRKEIIGGIKGITLDRHGPIYEAHLFMGVQRAREALEICERKACGSSFGYDAIDYEHDQKGVRHLKAVKLHEISQVTFAANSLAPILDVKSRFFVPSNLPNKQMPPVDRVVINTGLKEAGSIFEQLTKQLIRAHEQYKWEAELNKPRFRR